MTSKVKIKERNYVGYEDNYHAGSVWYGDKEFIWSAVISPDDPEGKDVSLDTVDGYVDLSEGTFVDVTDLPDSAYHEIMDALNEYVRSLEYVEVCDDKD